MKRLEPEEHVFKEPLRRADLDLPVPVEPEEPQLAGHHVSDLVAVGGSASAATHLGNRILVRLMPQRLGRAPQH